MILDKNPYDIFVEAFDKVLNDLKKKPFKNKEAIAFLEKLKDKLPDVYYVLTKSRCYLKKKLCKVCNKSLFYLDNDTFCCEDGHVNYT